jgi:hypothetical protein
VAGVALLLLESIRALHGDIFSTLATILLYLGLGLLVLAGVLLVLATAADLHEVGGSGLDIRALRASQRE